MCMALDGRPVVVRVIESVVYGWKEWWGCRDSPKPMSLCSGGYKAPPPRQVQRGNQQYRPPPPSSSSSSMDYSRPPTTFYAGKPPGFAGPKQPPLSNGFSGGAGPGARSLITGPGSVSSASTSSVRSNSYADRIGSVAIRTGSSLSPPRTSRDRREGAGCMWGWTLNACGGGP
jgi:hypothetical protein